MGRAGLTAADPMLAITRKQDGGVGPVVVRRAHVVVRVARPHCVLDTRIRGIWIVAPGGAGHLDGGGGDWSVGKVGRSFGVDVGKEAGNGRKVGALEFGGKRKVGMGRRAMKWTRGATMEKDMARGWSWRQGGGQRYRSER